MTVGKVTVLEQDLPSGHKNITIVLAAPQRSNSLEPEILSQLREALDRARGAQAAFVRLAAEGRHFSTGGDVFAFLRAANKGEAERYSETVVGALQDIVVGLLEMPAIVLCAAQGAITGGSAGLLFASDLVVLAEDAFVQPYFAEVGFGPDGGWTAVLPERIGAGRALQWQLTNSRMTAAEAVIAGLAVSVAPAAGLGSALDDLTIELDRRNIHAAMVAAKRLVWNRTRIARVKTRLKAERRTFCNRITAGSTQTGMERFVKAL